VRIAVWHNLPSGGAKRALYEHVRGLIARGHTVESWCPPTADQNYLPLSGLIPEHVVSLDWPMAFRHLDEWQITLEINRALAAMEGHCRACAADIKAGGFDVLLANSCQFFAVSPIGRLCKMPTALYLQEPFRKLYEAMPALLWQAQPRRIGSLLKVTTHRKAFADWRRIRNWRIQVREEATNAAAYHRILVNSRFSRESVLRVYGLDAEVCYLGVDSALFVDRSLARGNTIVSFSSIQPAKNISFCIEAIALLPEPRPELIWAGNSVDRNYLHEIQALARARNVKFTAHVGLSDDALIDILNCAMLMVYAPRLEPFGLAPLEAGACGTPVVAVAEGGVRETIEDEVTGLLVESCPAAMAAAIQRLQADPALRRRLGEGAKLAAKTRWSVNSAIDRLEQALLRLVAMGPISPPPSHM
jgi:glycosyltransferase involved in cell wall biosynthesis